METAGGPRLQDLVAQVIGGDPEAFRELFALAEPSAYALALGQLGNAEDAREVVQEAALASYRGLKDLRSPEKFPAWVCGIVRYLGIRRLRRRKPVSLSTLSFEPEAFPVEEPVDAEEASRVREALASLPSGYREALLLRHVEGKSYEEIAELLGLSVPGVDSRLSRGRALLRRKLETSLPAGEEEGL